MTRRPRALLPRLTHIERELAAAAALLPAMIEDAKDGRAHGEEIDARLMILVPLVAAALLLHRLDPHMLHALVEAFGPDGDLDEAEAIATVLLEQVMASMADHTGEGH